MVIVDYSRSCFVSKEELLAEFVKVDQLLGEIITSLRDKISTVSYRNIITYMCSSGA